MVETSDARAQEPTWDTKRTAGWILGGIALVILVYAAWMLDPSSGPQHQGRAFHFLVFAVGMLTGWSLGILLTPKTTAEAKNFPEYVKVLSGFATGFLLAELQRFADKLIANTTADAVALVGSALLFFGAFLLGGLFTYIGRSPSERNAVARR